MTYLTLTTGGLPGAPTALSRPVPLVPRLPAPCAAGHLDTDVLRLGVALRRRTLQDLEAELVGMCEAAAGQGDPYASAPGDREHWDRSTWRRYLDAALRLERYYTPRMGQLRNEIARLERLLDLTAAA